MGVIDIVILKTNYLFIILLFYYFIIFTFFSFNLKKYVNDMLMKDLLERIF